MRRRFRPAFLYCLAAGCLGTGGAFLFAGKPESDFTNPGSSVAVTQTVPSDHPAAQTTGQSQQAAAQPSAQPSAQTAASGTVREQPLPVDESAKLFSLADGYRIQLLAAEPNVASPVDAAIDDRGRLWVVEMIDYPFKKAEQAEPRGRIRILTDANSDGKYDTASVFADRLDMPTGIGLWRDGAVITLSGQLVWMRDTDNDGRVDTQQVWLEGFAQQNEQLRANHPRLELDGRWYIASGLRGGKLQVGPALRGDASAEPLELGTRDVRLDPRTGRIEAITGPAQFGLTSDLTGTRMFCSNRNPCVQVVLEQSLLAGNPLAGLVPAVVDVLPSGEASHVYPLVDAWTTSNLHAGQFTAACGVYFQHLAAREGMQDELVKRIHRDTLGEVFVCEPTGSLVHRQAVTHIGSLWSVDATGVDATATRQEWLASRDPWFRPVNVVSAPGAGVLVIDMHRAVIEHPAWVPDELKNRPDERYGEMAGRIYWVAANLQAWPSELMSQLATRPLGGRPSAELVDLLRSSDAWVRRTAARLLIERDAVETVPALLRLVSEEDNPAVETQVVAWQLISLFDPAARNHLNPGLTDYHRLVQITALRMLSRLPAPNQEGADKQAVESTRTALQLALATADPWLRLEATISAVRSIESLPAEEIESAAEALGRLAAANVSEAHLLVACAAVATNQPGKFLLNWLDGLGGIDEGAQSVDAGQQAMRNRWIVAASKLLVTHVGKQQPDSLQDLVARVRYLLTTEDPVSNVSRLAAVTALGQHIRGALANGQARAANAADEPLDALRIVDRPLWRKIRELVRMADTAPAVRQAAVDLLSLSQRKPDRQLLSRLVEQAEDTSLRTAAIRAWCEQGSPEAEEFILSQVGSAGPGLRPLLMELLLAKPDRQAALLSNLQSGKLTAKQLGAVELKRLVDRARGDTKQGLQQQLESILNTDRVAVLKQYQSALDLPGDMVHGKQVFVKHCAACHRIGDVGVQVGPDISDSRVQTADKLLTSILDPNRAIDNSYFRYVVLTSDGRTLDGLIAEETADKIVLRAQNDQRHVIAREEIQQLQPTGVSMMPEGLESQIDPAAMADLIAFIKNWRYTGGQVPPTIKAGK